MAGGAIAGKLRRERPRGPDVLRCLYDLPGYGLAAWRHYTIALGVDLGEEFHPGVSGQTKGYIGF